MKQLAFLSRTFLYIVLLAVISLTTSCKKDKEKVITSVKDENGNTYKVVVINDKYWMAENLISTKAANGSTIPTATSPIQWSTSSACCCWFSYNNSYEYYVKGKMFHYNSVAMKANPCPKGWRVPSSSEWNSMISSIGGTAIAGGKLKSTNNNEYWIGNVGATNSTGFTAYGSGFTNNGQGSNGYRSTAHFWTSDMSLRELAANNTKVSVASGNTLDGYSIRCIKDLN